jgi:hypothetical protein
LPSSPRTIALIGAYNEERFIVSCLENLIGQGLEAYLLDNDSTDATVPLAERYLGRGLLAIERFPRIDGRHRMRQLLLRKEELASTLDADWFMHGDPDEIRLPPPGVPTLKALIEDAERRGCNAVNFQELTFLPTREEADHDHPRFERSMRFYYPFAPTDAYHVKLWKRQRQPVGVADSGGHRLAFPGLALYPNSCWLKHYPMLGAAHAVQKYALRLHDPTQVAHGWHGWRARVGGARAALSPALVPLPSRTQLRYTASDEDLDATRPLRRHPWMEAWAENVTQAQARGSEALV